jgi:hypothetical protein
VRLAISSCGPIVTTVANQCRRLPTCLATQRRAVRTLRLMQVGTQPACSSRCLTAPVLTSALPQQAMVPRTPAIIPPNRLLQRRLKQRQRICKLPGSVWKSPRTFWSSNLGAR